MHLLSFFIHLATCYLLDWIIIGRSLEFILVRGQVHGSTATYYYRSVVSTMTMSTVTCRPLLARSLLAPHIQRTSTTYYNAQRTIIPFSSTLLVCQHAFAVINCHTLETFQVDFCIIIILFRCSICDIHTQSEYMNKRRDGNDSWDKNTNQPTNHPWRGVILMHMRCG